MARKAKAVRVGDRVEIDSRFGSIRSIGYSGASQLVANVDMDDGGLCTCRAASLTAIDDASREAAR